MTNLKWLTLPLALFASVAIGTHTAQADGDKKSRLCRHLKMIYLLNSESGADAASEVKEKYGAMACGQMSSNTGRPNGNNSEVSRTETQTAVARDPDGDPTTGAVTVSGGGGGTGSNTTGGGWAPSN